MSDQVSKNENAQIRIYRDSNELALKAARLFARLADQYVVGCGRFSVALSGGSTPKAMFALLAASPFRETIPWSAIHFFWGDERCVPPDHADSNYRMTRETLLANVPVSEANVHRIPAEQAPAAAAAAYARTLRDFFLTPTDPENTVAPDPARPRFDLTFLGMGADGHTGSLFPHSPSLPNESDSLGANFVEKLNAYRSTLTANTINNARNVTFLVAGEDKDEALKQVLEGPPQIDLYPSQMIQPARGSLLWLLDEAAASRLGA